MPALAERARQRDAGPICGMRAALGRWCWRPSPLACVWRGRHRAFAAIVGRGRLARPGALEWLAPVPRGRRRRAGCCVAAGLAYVVARPAAALLWLRDDPAARVAPTCCSCCSSSGPAISAPIWSAAGSAGPRLAPRISPGKTWSGAVGGLLAAIVGRLAGRRICCPTPRPGAALSDRRACSASLRRPAICWKASSSAVAG